MGAYVDHFSTALTTMAQHFEAEGLTARVHAPSLNGLIGAITRLQSAEAPLADIATMEPPLSSTAMAVLRAFQQQGMSEGAASGQFSAQGMRDLDAACIGCRAQQGPQARVPDTPGVRSGAPVTTVPTKRGPTRA